MIKKITIFIFLIVTALIFSGCLPPGTMLPIAILTPTPSPVPAMDEATMLSVALADISENQVQYSGTPSSPLTDRYFIEELNKLLSKRVYKEDFPKIEVINAVWLIPNDNPDKIDLLLIIDCNGQPEDCTIKKTASEIILLLQWLPEGKDSSVYANYFPLGENWAFPVQTRYVFFYICNTKNRKGYIKVTGNNLNNYINGSLPGESLTTLIYDENFP